MVDCANGAGYKVAPAALWELGAEVITINNEPNGININEDCGSTHPIGLMKRFMKCAPMSALRSMAMRTVCCWSMKTARSLTATS